MANNDIILIADRNGNPIGGVKANSSKATRATLRANARSIVAERLSYGAYGAQFGGTRDYIEILGYNPAPTVEDYLARFEYDAVAGRIVEFPADETWRDTPTIKDGKDKDAKEDTPFCEAWSEFAEKMDVYRYCSLVDTAAGIGRFALLHIGVSGHGDLKSEVRQAVNPNDIIYLQSYCEDDVEVYEWQTNANSPRFGLPHLYKINISHMEGAAADTFGSKELLVHWSRCIHVAEGLLKNKVYGRPRLQRVLNLLDDILKVVGGSAEATWKLMRKGFVLNLDADTDMDDADADALEEQLDEYDHNLRRYLKTRGMTVTDLGSEVVDPSKLFDVIITLISVATRIPKRILLGSERGELASSQDASNWAGAIASRQLNYAEPVILRPFIDRLIRWRTIPAPSAGRYTVAWDALFEKSEKEQAEIANIWAQAAEKAAKATGGPVMTAEEFRGEFTPFPADLPDELVDARKQAKQAKQMQPGPGGSPPDEGKDVLDQVADVLANHGFNGKAAKDVLTVVANVVSRNGHR